MIVIQVDQFIREMVERQPHFVKTVRPALRKRRSVRSGARLNGRPRVENWCGRFSRRTPSRARRAGCGAGRSREKCR